MSFSLKSVPQDDREVEYRDTPFPSLFDAILGRLGMMTKGADDDWVDDYISKQQNRESGYSISVTAGADGEEDDDDDDDDVEYLDKETNIALAMYDVLSSPASVKAEQDAAEAILGVQDDCEEDFIARCTDEYYEERPSTVTLMDGIDTGIFQMFSSMQPLVGPVEHNVHFFRRRLMESEEHQKKLARTSKGMKLLHDLRDMIVPASFTQIIESAAAHEGRHGRRLGGATSTADPRRQNMNVSNRRKAIRSGDFSRKDNTQTYVITGSDQGSNSAELEKLESQRSEYSHNPNRSKLSTRLSSVDRERQGRERTRRLLSKEGDRDHEHHHFEPHHKHEPPPAHPSPPPPPPPVGGKGHGLKPAPAQAPPALSGDPSLPKEKGREDSGSDRSERPPPPPAPAGGEGGGHEGPGSRPGTPRPKAGPGFKTLPNSSKRAGVHPGTTDGEADGPGVPGGKPKPKPRPAGGKAAPGTSPGPKEAPEGAVKKETEKVATRRLEGGRLPVSHGPPPPPPPPPHGPPHDINPHVRIGGPFLVPGASGVSNHDIDDGGDDKRVGCEEDVDNNDDDSDISLFLKRPQPSKSRDVFSGSLGYGPGGDMCMYRAYPKLSSQCKAAITDLYDFRQEYVESNPVTMSASPYHVVKHHAGHPAVAVSVVTFLVLGLFVTFRRRQKNVQIRKVLDVIDGNPALKAQVEALAGCEIPKHNSGWKAIAGIFKSGFKGVFYIMCCVILCFVIAVVSLICTSHIVGAIYDIPAGCDSLPDDDPACQGPSPFFALFILLCVIAVNIYLSVLAIHACRLQGRRRVDQLPPSPTQADVSHGDYVALSGTESEMESFHGGQVPTIVSTTTTVTTTKEQERRPGAQEQAPQGVVTGRLVRAMPVSGFSMI